MRVPVRQFKTYHDESIGHIITELEQNRVAKAKASEIARDEVAKDERA